jgi:hypothetical protein
VKDQESGDFSERLLLPREFPLEPSNALGRRNRNPPFLVEREPPLFEFREEQSLLLEEGGELCPRHLPRLGENTDLFVDRPGL